MTSRREAARGVVAAVGRLVIRFGGGAGQMVRRPLPVLSHVAIVVVSAAVAASLPFTFSLVAQRLLVYWAVVENERVFLVSAEVAVTLLLILVFSHAGTNWRNRRLAKMARAAGMVQVTPGPGGRRATRRWNERRALVR